MSGIGLRATGCHHTITDSVVIRQLAPTHFFSGTLNNFLLNAIYILFIDMKEAKHISEVIHEIEAEMVTMWSLGEAPGVMERDEEYIVLVLTAVFFEREHFKAMGMIVGEA